MYSYIRLFVNVHDKIVYVNVVILYIYVNVYTRKNNLGCKISLVLIIAFNEITIKPKLPCCI